MARLGGLIGDVQVTAIAGEGEPNRRDIDGYRADDRARALAGRERLLEVDDADRVLGFVGDEDEPAVVG